MLCNNNNYAKFCALGVDGHLYKFVPLPANVPVGLLHLFLYPLCNAGGAGINYKLLN